MQRCRVKRHQTLALASVAQCALWVQDVAKRGVYRVERMDNAIDSILCIDPETADAVYGGVASIRDGLEILHAQLGREACRLEAAELAEVSRYMGQLLRLAGKVQRNSSLASVLREGLEQAQEARRMGATTEVLRTRLADLYTRTISQQTPRVMVNGDQVNLENIGFVETIRLFLLCGVRSGVLWRQCGGRMWRLLLQRNRILEQAHELSRRL